jgi:hypothetical protein
MKSGVFFFLENVGCGCHNFVDFDDGSDDIVVGDMLLVLLSLLVMLLVVSKVLSCALSLVRAP